MPLSRTVARLNRRYLNRIVGRIAGWAPSFAIVGHTGRRSGTTYRTPVNAFRTPDGYRIALTYGAGSDWVRNVRAAGGCEIVTRRRRLRLDRPRLVADTAYRWAPPPVRAILARLGVTHYLQLSLATDA